MTFGSLKCQAPSDFHTIPETSVTLQNGPIGALLEKGQETKIIIIIIIKNKKLETK